MVRDYTPKYAQLATTLREAIERGEYRSGDELPTFSELREQHGVTVATVQAALAVLKREGLVESSQGRRTKVRERRPVISHSASYTSPGPDGKRLTWKSHLAGLGMVGEQRLGRVGEVSAPEEVAVILGLAPGDPVIHRPRVMLADGEPVELADTYYPLDIASGTPLAQQRLIKGGSIKVLTEHGFAPTDSLEELTFSPPGPEEAEKLQVDPDSLVVRMARRMLNRDDRVVELHVAVLKADRHRLTYRLPVHH